MNDIEHPEDSPETPDHDERERDIRYKAMLAAKETLRGMFDGLVILGTWTLEDGSTATLHENDGNYFCQIGVAQYWLKKRLAEADLEAADQHNNE